MTNKKLNFSKYLTDLRQKLGLSLVAFSKPLNCSPTQIKRMELGTVVPSDNFIQMICEVFKVDPDYFDGRMSVDDAVFLKDPKIERKQVGARLKEIRIERDLTLKELSKLTGLSEAQLCLIENGENRLVERRAEVIAEALNVGVDWLVKGDKEKKEYPVNQKMTEWLWKHLETRKEIWEKIEKQEERKEK